MAVGLTTCGEVEDVVVALTPVVGGFAKVFHNLLVELRLLLVAEVEDRQEEGWEVESGVQSEGQGSNLSLLCELSFPPV